MNNIFRILLLGALPLAAFPVIQASAQEPDIQTLLSAERSSFISGKARDILCRKLGTANLDTDKIRAMAYAPASRPVMPPVPIFQHRGKRRTVHAA